MGKPKEQSCRLTYFCQHKIVLLMRQERFKIGEKCKGQVVAASQWNTEIYIMVR